MTPREQRLLIMLYHGGAIHYVASYGAYPYRLDNPLDRRFGRPFVALINAAEFNVLTHRGWLKRAPGRELIGLTWVLSARGRRRAEPLVVLDALARGSGP